MGFFGFWGYEWGHTKTRRHEGGWEWEEKEET